MSKRSLLISVSIASAASALLFAGCGSNSSVKHVAGGGAGGASGAAGAGGTHAASGASNSSGGSSGHAGSGGASGGAVSSSAGEGGMAVSEAGAGGATAAAGDANAGAAGEAGAGGAANCSEPGGSCPVGSACEAAQCVAVAGSLSGLRWDLPCTDGHATVNCVCPDTVMHTAQLQGTTGASYQVTLLFRGIVEQKTYSGGTTGLAVNEGPGGQGNAAYFVEGATPSAGDTFNIYELDVSSPAQTFYLNVGSSGIDQTFLIDYQATITMDAGATVTLTGNSLGGVETFNRGADTNPVVVPDVPPAPAAFDGQFVQMDVVSVLPN